MIDVELDVQAEIDPHSPADRADLDQRVRRPAARAGAAPGQLLGVEAARDETTSVGVAEGVLGRARLGDELGIPNAPAIRTPNLPTRRPRLVAGEARQGHGSGTAPG